MKIAVLIVLVPVLYAAALSLSALAIQWAWNVLAPLWHGPPITFWHALAISVVLTIITGMFRGQSRRES